MELIKNLRNVINEIQYEAKMYDELYKMRDKCFYVVSENKSDVYEILTEEIYESDRDSYIHSLMVFKMMKEAQIQLVNKSDFDALKVPL